MKFRSILALVFACALLLPSAASASTQVVLPGDVARQAENTAPTGDLVLFTRDGTPSTAGVIDAGALTLSTVTASEKVFLFSFGHIGTKLADVDAFTYTTERLAGSAQQVAALNMVIDFNGPLVDGGFATLVFEPVYNAGQGAVVGDTPQTWTATGTGNWWSTRAIGGQCAGATAACDKTWDEIVANNPDATVLGGVGVNQGSGNPGLTTRVTSLTFDGTTYAFDGDADGDAVADGSDNCAGDANTDQADADGDGAGDVCDADRDGDGVANEGDNCADVANGDQGDVDGDGTGTACDTQERPASKGDCKGGNFAVYTTGLGLAQTFKSQGDCIAWAKS